MRLSRYSTLSMVLAVLVVSSGCGSQSGLAVRGLVTFQGRPVTAELSFEQLTADGKPQGRAVSANADGRGRFNAQLASTEHSRVRIVVRVTAATETALPAGFDGAPLGPKTVQLERDLSANQSLIFVLTQ